VDTSQIVMLGIASVALVLYLMRRRARLSKTDSTSCRAAAGGGSRCRMRGCAAQSLGAVARLGAD
jgi:hypothetical protein